jgi:hypothetical protein
MSNDKTGSAAGASRALQAAEPILSILCPIKSLSTLRMARPYRSNAPRPPSMPLWPTRRSEIGR